MKTVLLLGGPAAGQHVEVHGTMRTWAHITGAAMAHVGRAIGGERGPEHALYHLVPMCSHGEVHWFGVLDGADPLALLIAGYAPVERHAGMLPAFEAPYGAATDDTRRMDFLEDIVMHKGKTLSANRDRDATTSSPTYGDLPTVSLFTIPSQHVRGIGFRGAVDEAMAEVKS